MVVETLREQWPRVAQLNAAVGALARRLEVCNRNGPTGRRMAAVVRLSYLNAAEN